MNQPRSRQLAATGFGVIVAAIVVVLGTAISSLPVEATGLTGQVDAKLDEAGAKNRVTAVLLNFRGYDTLLEITVLLLAVLGARALAAGGQRDDTRHIRSPVNPVLLGLVRIVSPVMIVVAGYLLWVGGHAPGGAFQAGAVLAALGVLLHLGGIRWTRRLPAHGERMLLVAGLAVFLLVGVGTMWGQRRLLEFSPPLAKWWMLLIEAVAAISIAATLVALFRGGTLRDADLPRATKNRSGA